MTNTIELKTIVTADEPDRSKKYTNHALQQDDTDVPLHYVEGRGWTWGRCVRHYTWEEFLASFKCYFPLREIEREITVTPGNWSRTDTDGDSFELSLGYCGGPHRAYVNTSVGRTSVAYLTQEQLVELRDYLNENITVTEA